jgi:uncharacterized protein
MQKDVLKIIDVSCCFKLNKLFFVRFLVSNSLFLGKAGNKSIELPLSMANRHGLVAGATGTGKTITLQTLVQNFSEAGVSVFAADIKGDLSGLAEAGGGNPKVEARLRELNMQNFSPKAGSVVFWDIYEKSGHPLRATVSDLGPLLLARLLELNDTQEGVLNSLFKIADDQNLLLLDLKDLRAMLSYISENAKEFQKIYGNISAASVGAIQRSLLTLETQGGEVFFGEPMLNIQDLIRLDSQGRGQINILSSEKLMQSPKLYSTSLLWLLSELYENLPEVGDLEKPKIVFFFDEAHLLFAEAPKVLLDKIEQVIRLIRSKGVGIYFVTQNPMDIPQSVLAQLSHRVQHALRAFTPKDKKAVNTVAETMRENPSFKTEDVICELGVGEALVSVLSVDGTPSIVERVLIAPPASRIGPLTPDERKNIIQQSPVLGLYDQNLERASAFETLQKKEAAPEEATAKSLGTKGGGGRAGRPRQSVTEVLVKSAARTVANEVGKQIVRGLLGGLFGKR